MLEDALVLEANLKGFSADAILDLVEAAGPVDAFVLKAADADGLAYILHVIVRKGDEERFTSLLHEAGVQKVIITAAGLHTAPTPPRHLFEMHGREPPISHKK